MRLAHRDGIGRGDERAQRRGGLDEAMPDTAVPTHGRPHSVATVRVERAADDLLLTGAGDLVVRVR